MYKTLIKCRHNTFNPYKTTKLWLKKVTAIILMKWFVLSYYSQVEISDNGQPTLKSIAKVVVTVDDENDNDPKFVDQSTSISVPAMDMPDDRRLIYRMMATDKDIGSNAELSYFIRDGNTGSRFYIDATTGEVTCSKTASVWRDVCPWGESEQLSEWSWLSG